jgi:dihydroorotate dehydrogenase electron transfer subunit
MNLETCPVTGVRQAAEGIHVLAFSSRILGKSIRPGQFLNIRVEDGIDPLLRRPFSAYRVTPQSVEIIFNVVGRGTAALRGKRPGDVVDVLGPLGVPFHYDSPDYETAVLVGGGLGVAPLPVLTTAARAAGKSVITFLGGRSTRVVVRDHLSHLHVATDDGSEGFRGTVVDLLRTTLTARPVRKPMLFACGPTPMLRAVAEFARAASLPCEVSLEGPMGCGIGICQGCPVELAGEEKRYALMCKDGPVFDSRTIKL